MELALGKEKIIVNEDLEHYTLLRNGFVDSAIAIAEAFSEKYYEIQKSDDFWNKILQVFAGVLEMQSEQVCRVLFSLKVYDITQEQLVEKYYDSYFDPDSYIGEISEQLQKIDDFAQLRKAGREIRKATRGRWSGGGFSVGGALTSAVISSAFNAAGGLAYSIGNALANASDKKQIESIRREFFDDPSTFSMLCTAIYTYAFQAFFVLRDEAVERGIIPPQPFDVHRAEAMRINATKFAKTKAETFDLLAQSACIYPFDHELYIPLCSYCADKSEVDHFADYFGIKKTSDFFRKLDIMALKAAVEQSPEKTLAERVSKLHSLVSFISPAKSQGLSVENSITRVAQLIIEAQSSSLEKIREAKAALTEEFKDTDCEIYEQLLGELAQKETAILREKSAKAIADMKISTIENVLKKLSAICVHTENYHEYMLKDVLNLLHLLGTTCVEAETCEYVSAELKSLANQQYPQIQTAAEALSHKQEVILQAEKSDTIQILSLQKEPFVFAPIVIDLIDGARQGDAFSQLWLVETLLPDEILTNSLLDNRDTWQVTPTTTEQAQISENIAFLFDRPEQYPFDLFMRLRTALWTESAQEYRSMISSFSETGNCPAAQYEYGKYWFAASKTTAIACIKKAARLGYYPAMRYMRAHTGSEAEQGSESYVYYDVFGAGVFKQPLYQFSYFSRTQDGTFLKNEPRFCRLFALHQFLTMYRDCNHASYEARVQQLSLGIQTMGSQLKIQNNGKDCRHGFGCCGISKESDKLIGKIKKKIHTNLIGTPIFSFYDESLNFFLLITAKELCWHRGNQTHNQKFDASHLIDIDDAAFSQYYGCYQSDLWQIYSVLSYGVISYGKDCDLPTIEKMAFCGNPYAINHMLTVEGLSSERRHLWEQAKANWEAHGLFFRVCPVCREQRSREDIFCPECGNKIN